MVAGQIELALNAWPVASDRDFLLEDIIKVSRGKRTRRKSSRYHIPNGAFGPSEPPTDPQINPPDLGNRDTEMFNIDKLNDLRRKSKKP